MDNIQQETERPLINWEYKIVTTGNLGLYRKAYNQALDEVKSILKEELGQ